MEYVYAKNSFRDDNKAGWDGVEYVYAKSILSSLIRWIQHWWGRDRDTKGRQLWEREREREVLGMTIEYVYTRLIYIYIHTHIY